MAGVTGAGVSVRYQGAVPAFSPLALFSSGEQGAWYDPSDFGPTGTGGVGTLFEDSAGTTPITTLERPVGLMLDKRVPAAATGYYSGVFDGAGDSLSVADDAAFEFGAGDFTIECWVNFLNVTPEKGIISHFASNAGYILRLSSSSPSGLRFFCGDGTGTFSTIQAAWSPSIGVWYHVAAVRDSGNLRAYINGVQAGSAAIAFTVGDAATPLAIGTAQTVVNPDFNGYISNVRIVKGTCLYPGGTTFTPPTTPLVAISGTSLLTCQNATFIDNSPNSFAITANGNAVAGARNPFGNHAFSSSTARPALRNRYNLLTFSEQFDNAAWSKSAATVAANDTTDPLSGNTADKVTSTGTDFIGQNLTTIAKNTVVTASIYVKKENFDWLRVVVLDALTTSIFNGTQQFRVWVNLSTGQIGTANTVGTATLLSYSIENAGNGWYRVSITGSLTSADPNYNGYVIATATASADASTTRVASGEYYLWGAQLIATNSLASNAYQRIAAAPTVGSAPTYDTDLTKFPPYIQFDGVDDSMSTSSVDFATVTSDGQARRNLLLAPTLFDSAAWLVGSTTVSANQATAPDGTVTADLVYAASTGSSRYIWPSAVVFTASAQVITSSFYFKASSWTWVMINGTGSSNGVWFDIATGQKGTESAGYTGTITDAGNGWWRCTVTETRTGTVRPTVFLCDADNSLTATASGTNGIYIWGAQLETGSTATAFQNIGTDKMTVWAGVRKLSDSAASVIAELSGDINGNNGSFGLFTSGFSGAPRWSFASKGTTLRSVDTPSNYAAPITNIITGIGDISGDNSEIRINGTQQGQNTGDQGSGNFGNYVIYVGSRGGTLARLNGQIYSLIIRGAASTATQISNTESWVAGKMQVTL